MKQVNNTYAVLFLFLPVTFIPIVSIIIGCSEVPYTGSMLQPGDVDKYIIRPEPGKVCLQKNGEIICIDTTTEKKRETIIHIHGRRIIYTFYYEAAVLTRTEEPDSGPDTKDDMAADQDIKGGGGDTTPDNNGDDGGGENTNDNGGGDTNPDNNGGSNDEDNNNDNTEDPVTDPEIVSPSETVDPPVIVSSPETVDAPVQPQTVSCGGLSCHIKIINGKPNLFETILDGPHKGQKHETPISEEDYKKWLEFVSLYLSGGDYEALWND